MIKVAVLAGRGANKPAGADGEQTLTRLRNWPYYYGKGSDEDYHRVD